MDGVWHDAIAQVVASLPDATRAPFPIASGADDRGVHDHLSRAPTRRSRL